MSETMIIYFNYVRGWICYHLYIKLDRPFWFKQIILPYAAHNAYWLMVGE